MKVIYLLRHAKAGWGEEGLDDFDRELNDRGRAAAPAIGRHMAQNGYAPQLILCSSAVRTRQTAELLAAELPSKPEIQFEDELYNSSSHMMLNRFLSLDNNHAEIMVIGHNPGIQSLALMLTGSGTKAAQDGIATKYPTAALAVIEFPVNSWRDVRPSKGHLKAFVRPRDLATS